MQRQFILRTIMRMSQFTLMAKRIYSNWSTRRRSYIKWKREDEERRQRQKLISLLSQLLLQRVGTCWCQTCLSLDESNPSCVTTIKIICSPCQHCRRGVCVSSSQNQLEEKKEAGWTEHSALNTVRTKAITTRKTLFYVRHYNMCDPLEITIKLELIWRFALASSGSR